MGRLSNYVIGVMLLIVVNIVLVLATPHLTFFWLFCSGLGLLYYTVSNVVGAIWDASKGRKADADRKSEITPYAYCSDCIFFARALTASWCRKEQTNGRVEICPYHTARDEKE